MARKCSDCGAALGLLGGINGRCQECHLASLSGKDSPRKTEVSERVEAFRREATEASGVLVTTETYAPDLNVVERKGIVTAEVAEGMNVLRDMMTDVRGVVGGRSAITQNALRKVREAVIEELKLEAHRLGANAVIAVDLDYQEFGTTGRFLFVVASGTAVVIK